MKFFVTTIVLSVSFFLLVLNVGMAIASVPPPAPPTLTPVKPTATVDVDSTPAQKHNICFDAECKLVDGPGLDQCRINDDCQMGTHAKCVRSSQNSSNYVCMYVLGPWYNSCNDNKDCTNTSHSECIDEKCQTFKEPGISQCQQDSDCVAKPITASASNVSPQNPAAQNQMYLLQAQIASLLCALVTVRSFFKV